jgi:hypothetical protein
MAQELEDTAFLISKATIIRSLGTRMVLDAIEIGKHLTEVRDRLKRTSNGGFEGWIEREFSWSERHAYRFIALHEEYGSSNLPHVAGLSVRSLTTLMSAPPEIKEQVLEEAKDKQLTEKQVKELIENAKMEAVQGTEEQTTGGKEVLGISNLHSKSAMATLCTQSLSLLNQETGVIHGKSC